MPPAIAALALVAFGVPAALRGAIGRPRHLPAAWLAAAIAVALAQAAGELFGWRTGTLGDAQLLAAAAGATLATLLTVASERA